MDIQFSALALENPPILQPVRTRTDIYENVDVHATLNCKKWNIAGSLDLTYSLLSIVSFCLNMSHYF